MLYSLALLLISAAFVHSDLIVNNPSLLTHPLPQLLVLMALEKPYVAQTFLLFPSNMIALDYSRVASICDHR